VVVVEWADRLPDALPPDRLEIQIQRPNLESVAAGRVLHALSSGPASQAALVRWREALATPAEGLGAGRE
jgi:tRNA A37 threonylcarbamoyladenosine biosynthesis protein TsaE